MNNIEVIFSPEAKADLLSIYDYVADHSGANRAQGYVDRITKYCHDLAISPGVGTARDDHRPGLRTVGFERRILIAFFVTLHAIFINRVLYGGRQLD